jgi:tRNA (guanine37-N1)-methyltransferase
MLLVVGRIGRPHGIRGEVTIEVRTDAPEERFAAGSVLVTDPAAARPEVDVPPMLTIETVRWHQGRPLLLFDGVYDRDIAENLRNVLLCVDSADVVAPTDPDEFNDQDLIGMAVVSPGGEHLGEVARIDHAPASDLIVLDVVTIFPEYLGPLDLSLIGKARASGRLSVTVHDLRTWTSDVHRTVDDTPYGGGPGMVMRPEPWGQALDALAPASPVSSPGSAAARLVVPSPAGVPFTQALASSLAAEEHLIFACGRYEGIDQRVLDHAATRMPVTEISLGDYVLFGGEVAVLVIMEAVTRLLPGVLGNAESLAEESHTAGLLEAPVYTKPPQWRGHDVPELLRSGDHGRIARWRRDESLLRTAQRRPDMLVGPAAPALSVRDRDVLAEAGFQVPGPDMAK